MNQDLPTVRGFGDEWQRFDQSALDRVEQQTIFSQYFAIFPFERLHPQAVGFDLGCGSGRWAALIAPQVGTLHCIDASLEALQVAQRTLAQQPNCVFHHTGDLPLAADSADFGYSLGVLHHVPDPQAGLRACVQALKPGAPLLVYLYYAFDNRPWWFRQVWRVSNMLRKAISRLPFRLRYAASQALAGLVYFPLARIARLGEHFGLNVEHWLLAAYRQRSFYVMRTDALDRFGTRLEQRFTRREIQHMMEQAGLERIVFNHAVPYWCAVGYKA